MMDQGRRSRNAAARLREALDELDGALAADAAAEERSAFAAAQMLICAHRHRIAALPSEIDDPAWRLMLTLFVAHHEGAELHLAAAFADANLAGATGSRAVERLVRLGLAERHGGTVRRQALRLTDAGRKACEAALVRR